MISIKIFKKRKEKQVKKKRKALAVILLSFAVAIFIFALVVLSLGRVPDKASFGDFSYSLVADTDEERESFFAQFGYDAEFYECREVTVPEKGNVFVKYNELQIAQGLDLRGYGGYSAYEYVYRLQKNDLKTPIYGVILVYKDRVISLHFDSGNGSSVWGLDSRYL